MSHLVQWLIENPFPYLTVQQPHWIDVARREFDGTAAISEIMEILRFGYSEDLGGSAAELASALGFKVYGSCDDGWLQTTWRLYGPGGAVLTIEPMWRTPALLSEEYDEELFELYGEDGPDLPDDYW
jgi:hypothetical protein